MNDNELALIYQDALTISIKDLAKNIGKQLHQILIFLVGEKRISWATLDSFQMVNIDEYTNNTKFIRHLINSTTFDDYGLFKKALEDAKLHGCLDTLKEAEEKAYRDRTLYQEVKRKRKYSAREENNNDRSLNSTINTGQTGYKLYGERYVPTADQHQSPQHSGGQQQESVAIVQEQPHQRALMKQKDLLIKNMESIEEVNNYLCSKFCLSLTKKEQIESELEPYKQNERLVAWLICQPITTFNVFCDALYASHQEFLSEYLRDMLTANLQIS